MEKTTRNIVSSVVLPVCLLAFVSLAVYALYINQEVLYTAHDRSELIYGVSFFHTLMSKPFGLMLYVGAWLTQLFCQPAVGAGVLSVIWAITFFAGVKAFRLRGAASALMLLPIACLLASVVDLGYWIYIFSIKGYWFSQSVGYLAMLLLLWAARCTPRRWHLAFYLLAACLYPLLGWFGLLFILCLALSGKPSWRELAALVLLVFTASIWRAALYSSLNPDDVFLAGFPRFITPVESGEHLSVPFWVLGGVTVLISLCGRYLDKWFVPVLCTVAGVAFTMSLMFTDKNYISEMRMIRYAENDDWHHVLQVVGESARPTGTMVMLKNIALMNEGGLLERSFLSGNEEYPLTNPDSLHISLLNIASPLVYYNFGQMGYAIRLCFENAVATGFSPFYLKLLSRCAAATGEAEVAGRYTALLHRHLYYGSWQPAPVSKSVSTLQQSGVDAINGVENDCERYIVDRFSLTSDSVNQVVAEQALFYAMLRRDSRRFWSSLRNYVKSHMNEGFPLHAQEAYIMYMDKAPEEKRMMLPVEQPVYDRYKQFWKALEGKVKPGENLEKIGEEMRPEWGGTYWYYNIFSRRIY